MPAITPGSHVLVSGASGYIAAWTCQLLLERGFKVRGTVRSKEKGDYLSIQFEKFGDKWSYAIVEELTSPSGFDEAIKGIDGVAHIASPFHYKMTDPYKDYIEPAVNGTLSILKSANGPNGESVKRIVITSSLGAITRPRSGASELDEVAHVITEADWNEECPKLVKEKGSETPAFDAYCASKTLAEKAAWEFVEEEKPKFDLVTICPPYNFGPVIHQVTSANSLNTSVKAFYEYLVGTGDMEALKHPSGYVVDVRDVATAHIQALVVEQAGGKRYGVSERRFSWQETLDVIHSHNHHQYWPKAPIGTPGLGKTLAARQPLFDASKVCRELGLEYRPFETTILDMSSSLYALSKKWDTQS